MPKPRDPKYGLQGHSEDYQICNNSAEVIIGEKFRNRKAPQQKSGLKDQIVYSHGPVLDAAPVHPTRNFESNAGAKPKAGVDKSLCIEIVSQNQIGISF